MGDHFVLLVDRLLTESTLEAAIESRNSLKQLVITDDTMIDCSSFNDLEDNLTPRKQVECRICQDEDFDSHMEAPCSCRGSLKYAHRKCIQRWCNEKGDTLCEICHQPFKPGYTAPPPIFCFGGLSMNLRGHWRISRSDLNNPRIITVVSTDSDLLEPDNDEPETSPSRSIICCCSFAIICMLLLILRHTLPIIGSLAENFSFPVVMLLILRVGGIIVSSCIILKAVTSILHRRNQQANITRLSTSDEESGPLNLQQPT